MQKIILLFIVLMVFSSLGYAQDSTQGFHFSLGTSNAGVGIGDVRRYSGLHLNVDDQMLESINGINLSFVSQDRLHPVESRCNGIALSILNNNFTVVNGISASVLAELSPNVNGLSIGLFGNGGNVRNGISFGGIILVAHRLNGIGAAIVATSADTINGLSIALIGNRTFSGTRPLAYATGVVISGLIQDLRVMNGIGIAPYNSTAIANGIQIGLYNTTNQLHGLQIGILNHAENSVIPWFPGINIGW